MGGSDPTAGPLSGNDLYEAVVQAQNRMGEGIVVIDLDDSRIFFANDAFCAMSGYELDELQALGSMFELVPPDLAVELEQRRLRRLSGEPDPDHFASTVRRKDGTDFRAEIAASPASEVDPRVLVMLIRDISAREAAETALRESEVRYRSVLSALNEGVLLISAEGEVLAANPAAERILAAPQPIAGTTVGEGGGSVVGSDGRPLAVGEFPTQVTLRTGEPQTDQIIGLKRDDGSTLWLSVNTQGLFREGDGAPYAVVASFTDVTQRRRFEAELRHLADHDALTGLPNRRRFHEELQRHLSYVARYGGHGAALLLDLDNFKLVNDTLGHKAGDQYLAGVAHVLAERLRQTDVVARLGGDEFGVLLPAASLEQARTVAESLSEALRAYAPVIEGQPVKMTTSIGIACFAEGPAIHPDELLSAADVAMYDAKEAGRDRIAVASSDELDEQSLRARMHWVDRIRRALTEGRFKLFAQAILDVRTREIAQYELLLRMEDDDGRAVPASSFLGTAERFDLIQEIDRWVVMQAIELIDAHRRHGRNLRVEVNISAKSVGNGDLPTLIERELDRTGIDASLLILEITETAAIANMDEAVEFATRLSRLGCGFALDDFGRGFGSFYYLKHLPLNYLKIDGDFITNLSSSLIDQQVVKAVVQVASALELKTVAEFVGSEATMRALAEFGVDFAQGYYVAQPRALSPASSGFL